MDLSLPRGQGEFVVRIKGLPRSGWRTCGRTAGESRKPRFRPDFRGFRTCRLNPSGESGLISGMDVLKRRLASDKGFRSAAAEFLRAAQAARRVTQEELETAFRELRFAIYHNIVFILKQEVISTLQQVIDRSSRLISRVMPAAVN